MREATQKIKHRSSHQTKENSLTEFCERLDGISTHYLNTFEASKAVERVWTTE